MFFRRFEDTGLSHYSYMIGDGGQAAAIDPRLDTAVYLETAQAEEVKITVVFETHRNEDYLVGSVELADQTGAEVWHADRQADYRYGKPADPGQEWTIGEYTLRAIDTPGHTPGSVSYLLLTGSGHPYILFSGDTLFAGSAGRTDLINEEKAAEFAGQLHESIFSKILPLGEGVIVCPAHGAGSSCGSSISSREWTTLGIEKQENPVLQDRDRSNFIKQAGKVHPKPQYFSKMEILNLEGPRIPRDMPRFIPLSAAETEEKSRTTTVLDIRSETSFGAAHIPGSLFIAESSVASYAGWFMDPDDPFIIVADGNPAHTRLTLLRMGFFRGKGYLAGGMHSWFTAGKQSSSINMVIVENFCRKIDEGDELWILDVRSREELESDGEIPGAVNIPIKEFTKRSGEIPKGKNIHIFCGSGLRSTTAASLLKRQGHERLSVILGGFSGWNSVRCPIKGKSKGLAAEI
ncbi:MAG: MBL fold metallo-hydrolase [Spirochaetia bacterium]